MNAVLFLDVDGVLNHRAVFFPGNGPDPLCPLAVKRLCELMDATKAQIVLSSTWRLGGRDSRSMQKLEAAGVLDRLHADWRTVDLPNRIQNGILLPDNRRGREIAEWLSRHPEVTSYAIVDDDSDMLPEQGPFFVQTSFTAGGLQDYHVKRLAGLLGADA